MSAKANFRTGISIVLLGILLCIASAWCEVQAHHVNGQPVQELGSANPQAPRIFKERTEFYIASSLAIRLFTIGTVLIAAGAVQMQRSQTNQRISRLEAELASYRNRTMSAA